MFVLAYSHGVSRLFGTFRINQSILTSSIKIWQNVFSSSQNIQIRFENFSVSFVDTDLIHVKRWAGGFALALQMNLTFSWPTCQFLSFPIIDTTGATAKQKRKLGRSNFALFATWILYFQHPFSDARFNLLTKNMFYFHFKSRSLQSIIVIPVVWWQMSFFQKEQSMHYKYSSKWWEKQRLRRRAAGYGIYWQTEQREQTNDPGLVES